MKIRKQLTLIFGIGMLLIPIFSLSSCGLISNSQTYIDTTNYQSFIRERSMSLKFNSKTLPSGKFEEMFGTTWIIGKDLLNSNKYYLATNIHVIASAVIDTTENVSLSPSVSTSYKINDKYIDSVTLGFPKDPSKIYSENDLNLESLSNKYFPTVEYLGTSFNKFTYNTNLIPYSMTDIAVLGFDFSNTSLDFRNYLQYYEKNQTKFSLKPISYIDNNEYFIGGYPATNLDPQKTQIGIWKFDDSQNKKIKSENGLVIKPEFSTVDTSIPNINYVQREIINPDGTITYVYYNVYGSSIGTIFPNNINYANYAGLTSNLKNYSFQNIANQIAISDLNLEGGSSGSMTINQDFEVCGIYWGIYTSTVTKNDGTKFQQKSGSFDIFISDSYSYGPTTSPIGSYQKYNTLSDIKSKITNISGGNWSNI